MATHIPVTSLSELKAIGVMTLQLDGHTIALYAQGHTAFAVDNRCPHMGFPLDKGTVKDGILTCHWHHARFDLQSGGTFDQWADDVRVFPVEIRDGDVWIDLSPHLDPVQHQRERLLVGLERDLSLVIGKAVLMLLEHNPDALEPFRIGIEFGTKYRQAGWGQGLTIHTCLMNILSYLAPEDRPRALYHGLSAISSETFGTPPRFPVRPLPTNPSDFNTLKRWFRQFIEVRDAEGAERCMISAIRAGATDQQMTDMLFAAVTDHRYIQIGHIADFTNKAFEALDIVGWEHAETVLTSLVNGYAMADRMEEANEWRNPIDLVTILEATFDKLATALENGHSKRGQWHGRAELVSVLLADNPYTIADSLLESLAEGATEIDLASAVSYAAALRIARFHTSNEFGDWDTALHTFTFANAIEQALRRSASLELLRGVFDAAMSVYLDRFLNIPAARLPQPNGKNPVSESLETLLNQQQQVNQAGEFVGHYLYSGKNPDELLALLGKLLLREDRDFHTIQVIEAAFRQYQYLRDTESGIHVLVAAGRYLAAHSPTMRAEGQTYHIASRLHRGDHLFEEGE